MQGSIGPIGLKAKFRILADKRLEGANGLISGANKNDYHLTNIDFNRDVTIENYCDVRTVENGEPCPNCSKPLRIVKGIEAGHIFKLGTKYSASLKANFLDVEGKEQPIIMGSYGIGVDRIIACHIEQHHDEKGIIWSNAIAPYDVHLICVNANSESVMAKSEEVYRPVDGKEDCRGVRRQDQCYTGIQVQRRRFARYAPASYCRRKELEEWAD